MPTPAAAARPATALPTPLAVTLARRFPAVPYTYTERDVALYALALGCGPSHPQFTYEGDAAFATLPTFACVLPYHGVISDVPLHEAVPNFTPVRRSGGGRLNPQRSC